GRNSVMPWMTPRMTVLRVSDTGLPRVRMSGRHLNRPAFGTGRASQLVAQVLKRKARQRDIAAARERHDLEGLAHLLGHDEAACLAREPRALHGEARRLIMPEEMGEAFKVMALTREIGRAHV